MGPVADSRDGCATVLQYEDTSVQAPYSLKPLYATCSAPSTTVLGDRDLFLGNSAAVLLKDVEQHEQIDRAPVQDSREVATTVAAEFA